MLNLKLLAQRFEEEDVAGYQESNRYQNFRKMQGYSPIPLNPESFSYFVCDSRRQQFHLVFRFGFNHDPG